MDIGILAKTFPQTSALEVLSAVHAAGYRTTQFSMECLGLAGMPDSIEAEIPAQITAASQSAGISIAAISGTYNMAHPDPQVREKGLKRLELLIKMARPMGTSLVTLCTGSRDAQDQWRFHPDNASPGAWRDLCSQMERAAILAEQYEVDLGIEPELANVVSSAAKARRLIDTIKSARLKIVLDPANLFEPETAAKRRDLIESAVDTLADRIAIAHAKDRKQDGSFTTAGTGVIDFEHFVRQLLRAGFDGPLITHGLNASEAPSVCAFLHGVLARCQKV